MSYEIHIHADSRLEVVAMLPWVARLPKGDKRHSCEEYCYGRMPLYALFTMAQREERILAAINAEEPISEEDREYWDACRARSLAARVKGSCKLHAKWVYVTLDGHHHFVCSHHLDNLTSRDEGEISRCNKWWNAHVTRRIEETV